MDETLFELLVSVWESHLIGGGGYHLHGRTLPPRFYNPVFSKGMHSLMFHRNFQGKERNSPGRE